MLRTGSSRTLLVHRQFSSSSSTWNTTRPPPSPSEKQTEGHARPDSSTSSQSEDASTSTSDPLPRTADSCDPLAPYDLELVKKRIRDWTDQAAITIRNRADDFTLSTKTTFSQLGSHLNKVTGYEEIEALKREVVEQENRINATRQAARQAKAAYEKAVIQRSNSQREVNDSLQRKSTWTDSDVGLFTTLVKQDHLYEQEEARAKAGVDEMEDAVDREFSRLMRVILARYHEEQVWSDKIRSASTYGQLAALGLNLLVFVMAIVAVEPWKRRRLAQTFERKVEELSKENAMRLEVSMEEIGKRLAEQESMLRTFTEMVSQNAETIPSLPLPPNEAEGTDKSTNPESSSLTEAVLKRWDLALIGTGAFAAGIIGSLLIGR